MGRASCWGIQRTVGLVAAVMALGLVMVPAAWGASQDVHSSGPLTDVWVGDTLSCQVAHTGDSSYEFYPPSSAPGSCGTFLSATSAGSPAQLYGPGFLSDTAFTPVSQTPVTGAGTSQSPYQVTTVAAAGTTGLTVTEVDSYITGNEYYKTDITVSNDPNSGATFSGKLYHAGDCYLQGSDRGYGFVDPSSRSIACAQNANNSPPGLVEQFAPLTGGSNYVETFYNTVWNDINNQADLPNTCDCTTFQDNGAGINWDIASLSPGQSATFSLLSNFSSSGSLVNVKSAPSPVTGTPAPSSSTAAVLTGSTNPNGLPTTAHWEYGLDQSERGPGFSGTIYDQTTPPQSLGSDFSNHPIFAPVSNLVPNALYHVRLVATNSAGTRFGSDQTFVTPKGSAPRPPVLGRTENYSPVGLVFVLSNGKFVRLTEARQLPNGTEVDTLHGSLNLTSATGKKGKIFTGTFGGAVFKVNQARFGADKGLTTLSIVESPFKGGPSYASCKAKHAADSGAHAALSSRILQTLRSRSRGRYRTRGRYAAGTVRGTQWTTSDRCDGTLIRVQVHSVLVTDLVKHINVLVTAGHSYLAKAHK